MSLQAGLRLAQYEVLAPLGAGGMGEVYRARDSRLGRDVAIKIMAEHVAADPEMRQRFETEARAVAALSHPNILSIFELAVVNGRSFAVMELLEGETLRERLKGGALPWRQAVEVGGAIADGLAAAHTRGVIHRDLKPENLFLTRDGLVKILDFGLALHRMPAASLAGIEATVAPTAAGVMLGTFGYISPEQVLGQTVDGRSDIFALGCVCYEMLTGRRLFDGGTPQEVIANLMQHSVPELAAFDPLAPAELRVIVGRAVARDPARRFESARDLSMALRALLTHSARGSSAHRSIRRGRGKSLAVLPFVNAGADPQIEYLTDGITESIINSLSQLPGLRVVPRSVTFRYKGVQADPSTVGVALNARTILMGRVVQQGDLLNIQVELVDTGTESQLWGEQFRQKVDNLLAVQEEIAWQISEALRLKLTGSQKKRLKRRATVDPEAYQDYLRGRYHWNTWSPDGFRRALEHFERAISRDPAFATAWAGLGDTLSAMAYYGFSNPQDAYPRARAAAMNAIELDPELADPHVTLGIELLFHGWNWREAGRAFKKAIKLNPKLARAHLFHGLFCTTVGRLDDSIRSARLCQELEPLSPVANMAVAWALVFAKRPEDAVRETRRVLELAPGFEEAGNVLFGCFEALERFEEAAALVKRQRCWGLALKGDEMLAAYRADGPAGYWRKRLEQLLAAEEVPAMSREYGIAISLTHLGRHDDAIESIERLVTGRSGMCAFLKVDPSFLQLHQHPRFPELVKRIGIAGW